MSDTPLRDAINNFGRQSEWFDFTVLKDEGGEPSVTAEGKKDIGKGWSVGGAVQWANDVWATWGVFSWRPKDK